MFLEFQFILNHTQSTFTAQSHQLKHQNNKWKMLKVNNKDTRMTSSMSSFVNFEQIVHIALVFLLLKLNREGVWSHYTSKSTFDLI